MVALPMRIENPLHAPKTAFMAFTAQTVLPLYSSPRNDNRLEELVRLMAGLKVRKVASIPLPIHQISCQPSLVLYRSLPYQTTFPNHNSST
jgi:hypothetical protein